MNLKKNCLSSCVLRLCALCLSIYSSTNNTNKYEYKNEHTNEHKTGIYYFRQRVIMLRTIRFCVACAFTRLREQQEQNKGNHYGPKK